MKPIQHAACLFALCALFAVQPAATLAEDTPAEIEQAESQTLQTSKQANLRKLPNKKSDKLETLKKASVLTVISVSEINGENWAYVRTKGGREGYILYELLEPVPTPTPEPTQSPQLQAALAAREAFLNEQAVYSGYAVPANVSYAVSELPFAHTSPVAGYTSSGFGYRLHPLENKVKFHYGTDFAANSGTAVCAFADGTVLAAGQDDGYGNYVKVRHADGYTTLYGHCSKLLVRAGETVTAGQEIALVGATGKATGPHLHFELMHDGYYCNPEFYLAAV